MSFSKYCESLEEKIKSSYEEGVTQEQAERLAAEFLHAQMKISSIIKAADLDSRMKKTGLKAIKAATYGALKSDTSVKYTVDALEHAINLDKVVQDESDRYDAADAEKEDLIRYYNIFREAHIYFRGIGKGRFD